MFELSKQHSPSLMEAIALLAGSIGLISYFIIALETPPHTPILLSIFLLIGYGFVKRVPFTVMEKALIDGAKSGMGAVFLFLLIGVLISSWMLSGTIPILIDTSLTFVGGKWLYAIIFVITAIVGISLGSSFTTSATIGVAFIGMAQAMDASLAITAGAIVSGAFFGDKMSPLSDTTNLASSIVGVDLFTHIKNMMWTTIPAFLLSFLLFVILSPTTAIQGERAKQFQETIQSTGLTHWSAWIPLAVLVILSFNKVNAFVTLMISSLLASILGVLIGNSNWETLWGAWFNGYVSQTGVGSVDALLTRGGMSSMLFTISLVLLALGFGGLLFVLGIIPAILQRLQEKLVKAQSITITTALTAIGVNVLVGEQYLSILLTGETYQNLYDKAKLSRKKLSRTLEDAGTVINPLVPWSVCGVFLADTLGVPVTTYLPFAFFCLLSPILTVLIRKD